MLHAAQKINQVFTALCSCSLFFMVSVGHTSLSKTFSLSPSLTVCVHVCARGCACARACDMKSSVNARGENLALFRPNHSKKVIH